ncbi:MAG: MBL fold metallo-hydrolase [Phocaeicola sp.]
MRVTVLGSGTSTGVPEIGCSCAVCKSSDPRDRRLRCSALVECNGVRILLDCSADFREQMLRLPTFAPIDGVLITHEHYDHVGGIDDLRPFCRFRDVPLYAEAGVADRLKRRIPYCFGDQLYPGVPRILLHEVAPNEPFVVSNEQGDAVSVLPIRVMHGKLPILGYRIGNMAWLTDVLSLSDESYAALTGLELLFINALRPAPHQTHQHLELALQTVARIAPKESYFIHMSHQIGLHDEADKRLPEQVHFAYDGLVVDL